MRVEQIGDEAQDPIADAMAIGVVDPLEMIDVANRDADLGAVALEIGEPLLEGAAIGQVGERVAARLLAGLGELHAQGLRLVARGGELLLGRLGALDHRPGQRDQARRRAVRRLLEFGRAGFEVAAVILRLGARAFDHRRKLVHLPLCRVERGAVGGRRLGPATMLAMDAVGVALGKAQAVAGRRPDRLRRRRILGGEEAVDERVIFGARPQAVLAQEGADLPE